MKITIDDLLKGAEKFHEDATKIETGMTKELPEPIAFSMMLGATFLIATTAIAERLDRLTEAIEKHRHPYA